MYKSCRPNVVTNQRSDWSQPPGAGLDLFVAGRSGEDNRLHTNLGGAQAGTLGVFDSTLKDNQSGRDGGAIAVLDSSTSVRIVDSTLKSNTAARDGGAIVAVWTHPLVSHVVTLVHAVGEDHFVATGGL